MLDKNLLHRGLKNLQVRTLFILLMVGTKPLFCLWWFEVGQGLNEKAGRTFISVIVICSFCLLQIKLSPGIGS